MPKQSFENPFKTLLHFSKNQQKGILGLFSIIIILQMIYYFVDFSQVHKPSKEEQTWLALQTKIDTNQVIEKNTNTRFILTTPTF